MTVPFLAVLVLAPFLLAALARIGGASPRVVASIGAGLTLVVSIVGIVHVGEHGPHSLTVDGPRIPLTEARLRFGFDAAALVLVPLFASITLLAALGMPRASLRPQTAAAMLVSLGAIAGAACSHELVVLVFFFCVGALAPMLALGDASHAAARRLGLTTAGIGIALAVAATITAGALGAAEGNPSPFELAMIPRLASPSLATTLLVILSCAALTRMTMYPFQSWLAALVDEAPLLVPTVVVGDVGIVVLFRAALPLVPRAIEIAMPLLAALALFAAVRSALAALGQKRGAGLIACVAGSHLASIFAAVVVRTNESLTGALVEVVAVGVGTTGLLAVLSAVEARIGKIELRSAGRLSVPMPRAALAWFFFTFALVGFPGTLSFVGEDLVIHGLLRLHPVASLAFILASVLNALAMYRAGTFLFLGPGPDRPTVVDLLTRERVTIAILALLTVGIGVAPHWVVSISEDATIAFVRAVARP